MKIEQEQRERIIKAMAAAGYYYDDIASYTDENGENGWLYFNGDYCTSITFDSWTQVNEWLNGVVFDDPETSKAVDDILQEA